MKKFEFLDHTADAKFLSYGESLEDAFSNAALAMFSIITETHKVRSRVEKSIKISSAKKETLLYDFLEELIFFIDTESFLLHAVKSMRIVQDGDYTLVATVIGDTDKYEIFTHVKAVTYSDMFIKEEKNLVTIQVVLDL